MIVYDLVAILFLIASPTPLHYYVLLLWGNPSKLVTLF